SRLRVYENVISGAGRIKLGQFHKGGFPLKRVFLTALLLAAPGFTAAQTATPPTPVTTLTTVSDDPIYLAYPGDKYTVAFDHVLLEGSVKPGATFSIYGTSIDVGGDGLFFEWVPLQPGE